MKQYLLVFFAALVALFVSANCSFANEEAVLEKRIEFDPEKFQVDMDRINEELRLMFEASEEREQRLLDTLDEIQSNFEALDEDLFHALDVLREAEERAGIVPDIDKMIDGSSEISLD